MAPSLVYSIGTSVPLREVVGKRTTGGVIVIVVMVRSVLTSPGRWGLACGLAELLAEVRLVAEAAPKRNVAQRLIGRQHVLSGQFHATSHDESVRRFP